MYKPKLARLARHIPSALRIGGTRRAYEAAVRYGEIPIYDSYRYIQEYFNKRFFYASYGHRLKKFKDSHKGQRCFIIGNGPSIKHQDLTRLKDEISFVVNWFALHEQYQDINPTYYCISTREFFRDGDAQLNALNSKLYRLLDDKTGSAVKFLNYHAKPYVEENGLLPGHQIYYLNHAHYTLVSRQGISPDVTRAVHHGNTVIIDFCLHLALYMGFSKVYLLGCDCDISFQNSGDGSSHFHPDNPEWGTYKKLPPGGDPQKHSDSWYNTITRDYAIVKETFEHYGRKVYNAGSGGRLEVFPRVNYDELF
ncbi:MAG: hypothetical protein WC369_01615 [Dehalococcoidales bacterium]|jgi:hypothetical protein